MIGVTSKDGTFSSPTALNATYTAGPDDLSNGTVTLTLTSGDPEGPCAAVSDQVVITYFPEVVVDAGTDQSLCVEDGVAVATLAGSVTGGITDRKSGSAGMARP